jgi:tetratricopeptide (TPR) repeat protein
VGDLRPVLLKEAENESAHVLKPKSDAMPPKEETGDRYRLDGEIARGGTGAVLRGRDVDLGRDLAVKVLLEKYVSRPEVARRFIEEAQIGGQLQHPGVVPVYDIGRFGDRPFFTMKLIKGKTLAAILGERADATADRPRLLGIALQVAQTLAYVHAKGVIHRDLKPANVMVGAFGEVQVMDWGLAKVLAEGGVADEERASRARQELQEVTTIRTARSSGTSGSFGTGTEAGSLLGTPAYMPPEQANGDVANLDRRADVFGLGGLLCEILTGKPPYVGRSGEEVRRKAANGDLADALARLDACGADAELIGLTKLCLAAEAMDRPKDAQAVANGLMDYLSGVQERLQAAEREQAVAAVRDALQRKKRKVQLALAGAVALLLLGGGAFGWWQTKQAGDRRLADERAAAEVARLDGERKAERAQRQFEAAERVREDAARLARNAEAVVALLGQCETALRAGHTLNAAVALEAARKRSAEGGAEGTEAQFKRLGADLSLLSDLDATDQLRWTLSGSHFTDATVVAAKIREALKRFGADPDAAPGDEGATRLATSVVRARIVSALDRVLRRERKAGVRALLQRLDADPYRDAVRNAVLANDRTKVVELAAADDALRQPPGFAAVLGEFLEIGEVRRQQLLQAAVRGHPGEAGLLMMLGWSFPSGNKNNTDERLRWFEAAVAAAPANYAAHINLGLALYAKGRMDDAMACYQRARTLDPTHAMAQLLLGSMLCDVYRDYDGAIACFRKAIELDPKNAEAYTNMGNALKGNDRMDEAIAYYRKAIELDSTFAAAHCNLGFALASQGRFAESLQAYRRGHELGIRQPGWRHPSADWVRLAERYAAAEAKLPALLEGEIPLTDSANRLDLLFVCRAKKFYFTQVGLAAAAFAAEPKLADGLKERHRYSGACAAALAAAGKGADAPKLADADKAKLRAQALDWLRADLSLWTKQVQSGQAADRAAAQQALRRWQQDGDLASLRDATALAKLPSNEHQAFARLWADVEALLQKREEKGRAGPPIAKPVKEPDQAMPPGGRK